MEECNLCDANLGPIIAESAYWQLVLNKNQNSLGKCFLVLRRHLEAVPQLSPVEWADLHDQLAQATHVLALAFEPDHFNYAFLQNQDRHIHLHIIPRYAAPRIFAGITFDDPEYPGHYAVPAPARYLTRNQFTSLAEELRRLLKVPGRLPAGLRIQHISADLGLPAAELLCLFRAVFGTADILWPADQRWLLWSSGRLVGHVAIQQRWFIVNQCYFEGWCVGGVCVDPATQGHGLGTLLMRQAHAALAPQPLDFAVLNCGRPLLRFYERVGYRKISDHALYLRDGQAVLDEDPVLAISFKRGFDVTTLTCETFPFGFDF